MFAARAVWVCVVVVVAWCGVVAASTVVRPPPIDANVTSCVAVRPIFESKNLSAPIPDEPVNGAGLRVCTARGVGCCSARMEEELRAVVRRDFHALLHHNSRSLEGLLASTASFVTEHVTTVARQSQNRTMALLAQLYGAASAAAHEPVAALFADVLRALEAGPTSSAAASMGSGDASVYTLGAAADVSIEDSVHTFFAELFPLVFQHGGGAASGGGVGVGSSGAQRPLSEEYAACLRATAREVQPFGEVPRQLAHTASRTLEATRVLLQALWLGVEVLNSTDQLPLAGDCHAALLRMTFCARCAGLPRAVKPCVGYCLNVLRGCLTQHAGELDLPWNGFVEATERLAEAVRVRRPQRLLRSLLARVTEALMRAAEDAPAVHRKVKRACGPPRFAEGPSLPAPPPAIASDAAADNAIASAEDLDDLAPPPPAPPALLLQLHGPRQPPPPHAGATATEAEAAAAVAAQAEAAAAAAALAAEESEGGGGSGAESDALAGRLRLLLASLGRSRGFYANLAESLCSDESFAETRDTADCWNGQRLGEYSKVVVSSSSSAQKYNPELAWTQRAPDARIAQLSDKLRHIRQVVLSQLTLAPESDSYLRGGGGIDGSGSGGGEHWREEDTEEEEWVDQGSGSGVPPQDKPRTTTGVESQRPSGGSGASQPPARDDHAPTATAAAATTAPTPPPHCALLVAATSIAVAAAATRARLASG